MCFLPWNLIVSICHDKNSLDFFVTDTHLCTYYLYAQMETSCSSWLFTNLDKQTLSNKRYETQVEGKVESFRILQLQMHIVSIYKLKV